MADRHRFRAVWHDYNSGIYFVTMCCERKQMLLGNIRNGQMYLSALGNIAERCLDSIKDYFQNTEILNKVIMPNHIHIVISIAPVGARYIAPTNPPTNPSTNPPTNPSTNPPTNPSTNPSTNPPTNPPVGARYIAPKTTQPQNIHTPIHHNSMLAKIIGNYKAAVTREYRQKIGDINKVPKIRIWQRLYHEHIIRTQKSYDNIMNYIDNNIENWHKDCFHNPAYM